MDISTLPITRENIKLHYKVSPFTADTETTGFKGCTIFHPLNKILEISAICMATGERIDLYATDSDTVIIKDSAMVHGITTDVLKSNNAKSTIEVMKEFLLWLYDRSEGKTVVIFAHNARFDFFMMLKSIPINSGKDGKNLNFIVIDTLTLVKHYYPEMKYNAYDPKYQNNVCRGNPHSLPAMSTYLLGTSTHNLHNSLADCVLLEEVIMKFLLPHITVDLNNDPYSVVGVIRPRDLYPSDTPPMMERLVNVKYVKGFIKSFVPIINQTYQEHGMGDMMTTHNLISVFDVYNYGWLRRKKDIPPWEAIIEAVETLMRKIGIFADDIQCELFSYMTNRTSLEFAINTVKEDMTPIYPSMPGKPISYLPFNFNESVCKRIHSLTGARTSHEFYLYYMFSNMPIKKWVNSTLSLLKVEASEAFTEDTCTEMFNLIINKFY